MFEVINNKIIKNVWDACPVLPEEQIRLLYGDAIIINLRFNLLRRKLKNVRTGEL